MLADLSTTLATSRGILTDKVFSPLLLHAFDLAGVTGRIPRLYRAGAADGDQRWFRAQFSQAGRTAGIDFCQLGVFPMPNVGDVTGLLLPQDAVWVSGDSAANLLALWRLRKLDRNFGRHCRPAWYWPSSPRGLVCWLAGETTDSFGPASCPTRTASITTPSRSAGRCTSAWSRTARCPADTPPTTAPASSTVAPR